MKRRYFSIEEAEAIIPILRHDLLRLMTINKSLSLINNFQVKYENKEETAIHEIRINKRFHRLSYEYYRLLERIQSKGCVIENLGKGFVDFHSKLETHDIYLCWNITEDRIKSWHELDQNYLSRKPISILKTKVVRK